MTEFELAPAMGKPWRARRAFPLAPGVAGFLDAHGSRSVASQAAVRTAPGPEPLVDLCVLADRKTTVALSHPEGERARPWIADAFDGPLRSMGIFLSEAPDVPRPVWISSDSQATSVVDCGSGTIEHVGPAAAEASVVRWTPAVRALALTRAGSPPECLVRTAANEGWSAVPNCIPDERGDGLIVFHTRSGSGLPICALVVDASGSRFPCGPAYEVEKRAGSYVIHLGPRTCSAYARDVSSPVALARYYGERKVVVPGPGGGLFRVGAAGNIDREARVTPEDFVACSPVAWAAPIFECASGDFDVIVDIGSDGAAREELRRRRGPHRIETTLDGGIAFEGRCAGGDDRDIACVRSPEGRWRDIRFSEGLLARGDRPHFLVPTRDGELYVMVDGASIGGLQSSDRHMLLFRAEGGAGAPVPTWTLPSRPHEISYPLHGAPAGWEVHLQASLEWLEDGRRARIWPEYRRRPDSDLAEACGGDLEMGRGVRTDCAQGRLVHVGRFGLLEKKRGELYETLDAGRSWTRVPLPEGADTEDTECFAIGCRIGPYWRMGWGTR